MLLVTLTTIHVRTKKSSKGKRYIFENSRTHFHSRTQANDLFHSKVTIVKGNIRQVRFKLIVEIPYLIMLPRYLRKLYSPLINSKTFQTNYYYSVYDVHVVYRYLLNICFLILIIYITKCKGNENKWKYRRQGDKRFQRRNIDHRLSEGFP